MPKTAGDANNKASGEQTKLASNKNNGASAAANKDADDDDRKGNHDGKNKSSSAVAITKLLSKRCSSAVVAIPKTSLSASNDVDSDDEQVDVKDGFIAL